MQTDTASLPKNRKEVLLDKLVKSYGTYFDVSLDAPLNGWTLPVLAHFTSRGEKYVISKKAQLWAVECEEYAAVFDEPNLTEARMAEIIEFMQAAEQDLVRPRPDHMYTHLTAIVLTSGPEEGALRLLRRNRFRKNYKFSVHGFSTLRMAVVDVESEQIHKNRDGREVRKFIHTLLHPKPPKQRRRRAVRMGG